MPWTETVPALIGAVVGAVVGGGITGFFAFKGVDRAHERALERASDSQNQTVQGVLQAIHDEIEVLWERYMTSIGFQLEALPTGSGFLFYWPVLHDYFTVYNSNAHLIGYISDVNLRHAIVKTYTLSKALVDSYRMNNEILIRRDNAYSIWQRTKTQDDLNFLNQHLLQLQSYAPGLKEIHKQLKSEVENLLRELRKSGVLVEKKN